MNMIYFSIYLCHLLFISLMFYSFLCIGLLFLWTSLVAQTVNVCLQCRRPRFDPWVGKIHWRRKWQSTPVLLPGKSHGQRSLVGYSPRGGKESDTTERLHLLTYEVICIQHRFSNTKLSIKLMDFDFGALTEDMCPKKGNHISVVVCIHWNT